MHPSPQDIVHGQFSPGESTRGIIFIFIFFRRILIDTRWLGVDNKRQKCLLCHTLHVCNNRIGNLLWTNMSSTNSQDEKPRNIIPIVSEYNRHCATSLLSVKLHHFGVSANFFAKLFHYLRMFGRTDEFWKMGFSVFEAWYLCAWDAKNCNSNAFRKTSI